MKNDDTFFDSLTGLQEENVEAQSKRHINKRQAQFWPKPNIDVASLVDLSGLKEGTIAWIFFGHMCRSATSKISRKTFWLVFPSVYVCY